MFKNLILYRITPGYQLPVNVEYDLGGQHFSPCLPSQEKSIGWIPPRDEQGPLMEVVDGQYILKAKIETKVVPGSVIDAKFKEVAKRQEEVTGRKPGKKESRELKDDIKLQLLPSAFPKEGAILVWLDLENNLLAIDTASQARADEVVTLLIKSVEGLSLELLNTQQSPSAAMTEWLITQDPPAGFTVDRECELKASDESKATIKYGNHPLDIDEVKANVEAGKLPTKLALTWGSRVSFVLTEGLQIKKLAFLDVVFEGSKENQADAFDADLAIATGELRKLIPDLVAALGGEPVPL